MAAVDRSKVDQQHASNTSGDNPLSAIQSLLQHLGQVPSRTDFKFLQKSFEEQSRVQKLLDSKIDEIEAFKKVNTSLNEDKKRLTETCSSQEAEVEKLGAGNKTNLNLLAELRQQVSEQDGTVKKLKDRIGELQKQLRDKESSAKELDTRRYEAAQEASQLKGENKAIKEKMTGLRGALKRDEERLEEIEGFASPLYSERTEVTMHNWKLLGDQIRQFVESSFEQNLPETVLKNDSAWKTLSDPSNVKHNVPLPRTNSMQAKHMRMAVIFSIIARSMDLHIFQPTYLFGEGHEAKLALLRQAVSDSRKEAFFRRLLLSICPEEQEDEMEERLENVVDDVKPIIDSFSVGENQTTANQGLIKLLRDAKQTWYAIRSTEQHFAPSFEGFRSTDWQALSLSCGPSRPNEATPGNKGDGMLAIFPALYIVENNEKPRCLIPGSVLCRSQIVEAEQELDDEQRTSAFGGVVTARSTSRKQRSKSISGHVKQMNNEQPFLGISGNGQQGVGESGLIASDAARTKV